LKGSLKKLEVIGIVAVLLAVLFASVPGSVSADGGTVILHPGYITGTISITGETIDTGYVDAYSIPSGYEGRDSSIVNNEYSVTVEGGYDYMVLPRATMLDYNNDFDSWTHVQLKRQDTYVTEELTSILDFALNPGYVNINLDVTGGEVQQTSFNVLTNLDPGDLRTYNTHQDLIVKNFFYGSTILPMMPWVNHDENGDGDTTDWNLGDTHLSVYGAVKINDIWHYLERRYIDVFEGETTNVYWSLDVTPGSISGSVVVENEDITSFVIYGNAEFEGQPLYLRDVYPTYQDYYSEVPATTWEIYPDIAFNDAVTGAYNYLSLNSIPDTVTVGTGEDVVHNWNINPGYVTGGINLWGANTDLDKAYIYADDRADYGWPFNAYAITYSNDYKLILYEGEWDIGFGRNTLYFDYDPTVPNIPLTSNIIITDNSIHYLDPSTTVTSGETISGYDFSYGTATITINYEVEGGGELWSPFIDAYANEGVLPDRVDIRATGTGSSEHTTLGECTVTVIGGTYTVRAFAYVEDGSRPKFGELTISVEPGDVIIYDIGAPDVVITEPTGYQHVPGRTVLVEGTATDDSEIASITVNGVAVEFTSTNNPDDPNEVSYSTTVEGLDYGENTVTVVATDSYDKTTSVERTVISDLRNSPPVIISINGPAEPAAVGTSVDMTGAYSDPDAGDTHTATWDWGDGSEPTEGSAADGTASGAHTYDTPGVYTVTLTITDESSESAEMEYQFVVVYDPEGGFVTGGGFIESPEGAYSADETLTGKANFGFVSKYKKGATVPTGNTEFQFKAGDLNFHSDVYEWLIIAGAKAQFKGTGTVNGEGSYKFMLTAVDGSINGGSSTDKFRIKIWLEADDGAENIIYDNLLGAEDDTEMDATTVIGGGSIKIHKV
jgi:hypothetical protein